MNCDICKYRFRCTSIFMSKFKYNYQKCKKFEQYVSKTISPFNSKKYARNPREKVYALLKYQPNGKIEAFEYTRSGAYGWSSNTCTITSYYLRLEEKMKEIKSTPNYNPMDTIFIARVKSQKCPIEVDFVTSIPDTQLGNVLFHLKDNTLEYYKQILHLPIDKYKFI